LGADSVAFFAETLGFIALLFPWRELLPPFRYLNCIPETISLRFGRQTPARIIRDITMTEQKKTRREKLEEFLARNPNDAFSRYGIALECMREGDLAAADAHFQTLLETNPDYVPGYQMYAQMLAKNARAEEARTTLVKGIASATRQGQQHARSEMEALLSDLG
jgi:predicted Zn-dependent protease